MMDWPEEEVVQRQEVFSTTLVTQFMKKIHKYQNLMLKNKVNITDSGYGSSLDTGKDVDDDIELVLQENSSGDTCKSFWSYGAGLSVYRVVQWVYQIVRRTKVARILSHIDAVPENEIEDTIKEVAKELSVAFEYQLMMLYGDEEVIRLADHAVCCLITYLNSSDSTFSCSSLLQAAIETKPWTGNKKEILKTREVVYNGITYCPHWKLWQVLKQPGLRLLVDVVNSTDSDSGHLQRVDVIKNVGEKKEPEQVRIEESYNCVAGVEAQNLNHQDVNEVCRESNVDVETQNPRKNVKVGHYRPTRETPLEWRFAGGPIVASECFLAGNDNDQDVKDVSREGYVADVETKINSHKDESTESRSLVNTQDSKCQEEVNDKEFVGPELERFGNAKAREETSDLHTLEVHKNDMFDKSEKSATHFNTVNTDLDELSKRDFNKESLVTQHEVGFSRDFSELSNSTADEIKIDEIVVGPKTDCSLHSLPENCLADAVGSSEFSDTTQNSAVNNKNNITNEARKMYHAVCEDGLVSVAELGSLNKYSAEEQSPDVASMFSNRIEETSKNSDYKAEKENGVTEENLNYKEEPETSKSIDETGKIHRGNADFMTKLQDNIDKLFFKKNFETKETESIPSCGGNSQDKTLLVQIHENSIKSLYEEDPVSTKKSSVELDLNDKLGNQTYIDTNDHALMNHKSVSSVDKEMKRIDVVSEASNEDSSEHPQEMSSDQHSYYTGERFDFDMPDDFAEQQQTCDFNHQACQNDMPDDSSHKFVTVQHNDNIVAHIVNLKNGFSDIVVDLPSLVNVDAVENCSETENVSEYERNPETPCEFSNKAEYDHVPELFYDNNGAITENDTQSVSDTHSFKSDHSNDIHINIDIEREQSYKFYGCFTPFGAKCRPDVYGFRSPLHVWNEDERKFTFVFNDRVTVENSRARQIPVEEGNIHQAYCPKTSCEHSLI